MARETRRSTTERYKYGMCLNDECPKCKSKEIQQIPSRKEFVCEECGKELRECPPPKTKSKLPIFIVVGLVVLAAVIGGIIMFSGNNSNEDVVTADSTAVEVQQDTIAVTNTEARVDTVKIEKVIEKETTPVAQKTTTTTTTTTKSTGVSSGSLNLGYAKYTGSTQAGKPHGQGRMTFTSSHAIDSRDSKGRVADAGDYVIGEWNSGNLVQGRWYGSDGNVKGSVIIGM